jgi:DNA-binding NarL/FixJ family response regulator
MTKPAIAQELGIKSSSVIDATRKIYERLEVRNAAELGMKFLTAGPRH